MKKILVLTFLVTKLMASVKMTDSFDKGLDMALSYNKPLALCFTGSDWSDASKDLIDRVLADKKFSEKLRNEVIFVQIDFPEVNTQNLEKLESNKALKEKYVIEQFPTIVLLDPKGREISRFGASFDKSLEFANKIRSAYFDFLKLESALLHDCSDADLQSMYQKAKMLGSVYLKDKILKKGKSPFLLAEKYASLAENNLLDSKEAKGLKKQILRKNKKSNDPSLLRVAMLEYQSKGTIDPLLSFLKKAGNFQDKNFWKLHLICADAFAKKSKWKEAITHAKKSLESAPKSKKMEIGSLVSKFSLESDAKN